MKMEQGVNEMQNRRVTWKLGTKRPRSIFSHNPSVLPPAKTLVGAAEVQAKTLNPTTAEMNQ